MFENRFSERVHDFGGVEGAAQEEHAIFMEFALQQILHQGHLKK